MVGRQRRCPPPPQAMGIWEQTGHPDYILEKNKHLGEEYSTVYPTPSRGPSRAPPVPSPQTMGLDYLGHGVLCHQLPMCQGGSTPPSATHMEAEARRDTEPGLDPSPLHPQSPLAPSCTAQLVLRRPGPSRP